MPEIQYMLDTNTASYIIRKEPELVIKRLRHVPKETVCISAITAGELLYGISKSPVAKHLPPVVKRFILDINILPWDQTTIQAYASLRATCENEGNTLSPLDMLIAAHSISASTVLVSNDKSFNNIRDYIQLEDWTLPL